MLIRFRLVLKLICCHDVLKKNVLKTKMYSYIVLLWDWKGISCEMHVYLTSDVLK